MRFQAFDAATAKALSEAFEVAWSDLQQSNSLGDIEPAAARERLATLLIALANQGLRDPEELQATAVAKFVLE